MRSRASGGICGDSSAAPSAATMSSLRRRAIWVTRARSIARSSTGGRASARTTAPASPGSTSSRSQASRSRTSARWKNAAAPASRYGTARSSNATATAWPSERTERTSTQTSSGATSSRATSRSTSAATACACARSEAQRPERDLGRARPSAARSGLAIRSGAGSATAAAARTIRSPARKDSSSRTTRAAGHSASKSANAFVEAPRKRWIAWSSSPGAGDVAVVGRPAAAAAGPGRSSCPAGRRRARAGGGRPAARARAASRAAAGTRAARGRRSRACPASAQHPVVGAEQLAELALARHAVLAPSPSVAAQAA